MSCVPPYLDCTTARACLPPLSSTTLHLCSVPSTPLFLVLTLALLTILFITLSQLADTYLAATLAQIAKQHQLSPEVTATCLLSFANGAPDLFTAIASTQLEDFEFVAGNALGGALFIAALVLGMSIIVSPEIKTSAQPHKMNLMFLRNVIIFLIANTATLFLFWSGSIYFVLPILFIVAYGGFLILVLAQRWIAKRKALADLRRRDSVPTILVTPSTDSLLSHGEEPLPNATEMSHTSTELIVPNHGSSIRARSPSQRCAQADEPPPAESSSSPNHLIPPLAYRATLRSRLLESWNDTHIFFRIFLPVQYLVRIALALILPPTLSLLVDTPKSDTPLDSGTETPHQTHQQLYAFYKQGFTHEVRMLYISLNAIYPICLSVWIICTLTTMTPWFWLGGLLIGLACSIISVLLCTRKNFATYDLFCTYLTFPLSILHTYIVATLAVDFLETFGTITHMSPTYLAVTLLAWGNSFGDLFADTAVSRLGDFETAAFACTVGPIQNHFATVGVSLLIGALASGGTLRTQGVGKEAWVTYGFLIAVVGAMLWAGIYGFRRKLGFLLVSLYIAYLITVSIVAYV